MVRPEVEKFAQLMEKKLRENDHKRHWLTCSGDYHLARLMGELSELIMAVEQAEYHSGDYMNVALECADIANFAMFMADLCVGLKDINIELEENYESR